MSFLGILHVYEAQIKVYSGSLPRLQSAIKASDWTLKMSEKGVHSPSSPARRGRTTGAGGGGALGGPTGPINVNRGRGMKTPVLTRLVAGSSGSST